MLEGLPRLRRFARGLTGNAADADDLTQATAEKVLTAGVPGDVDVLRWMFKVCRNLFIDQLRALEVRRRAAEQPELVPETSVSGEAVALGELSLREVERAMEALSEDQRAVILLVAVEGLTYREAAEALDVQIGTVMSRLARARATLADQVHRGADQEETDRD
jgi:RNA polymerase sigma-70 factor (ECF subfamily)